jgi:HAD superfamily hydrolase (TIGR01484 family)
LSAGEALIVFTDLDGTLLDESYSFAAAQPALRKTAELDIPLVLCSSKTRREIEHYRKKLGNSHPFISENGGGIFIPEGYFPDESVLETFSPITEKGYRTRRCSAKRGILTSRFFSKATTMKRKPCSIQSRPKAFSPRRESSFTCSETTTRERRL